jgi:hypothetical protein
MGGRISQQGTLKELSKHSSLLNTAEIVFDSQHPKEIE